MTKQTPTKKNWWNWACEYCFKKSRNKDLPWGWDLIWQSAVCPKCLERAKYIRGGINVIEGGAFSDGKCDPRADLGQNR